MSEVLYRKYRSRTFTEVIGQDHVKDLLVGALLTGRIHHAYLFAGPRGTGKTTMARLMAKAVNDPTFSEKGDINLENDLVKLIEEGQTLDIIEMDAASNRGIEEIRQLKESINYLPSQLKYKVYIIDEAHMLTKEAFNALLKTLEEPPAHVIIILATTEPHKLPITILSRVQRYDFSLAEKDHIRQKLTFILQNEQIVFESEVLDIIYEVTGGSYRDAESLLSKLISDNTKELSAQGVKGALGLIPLQLLDELTQAFLQGDLLNVMQIIEKVYYEAADFAVFIDQYLKYLRDYALLLLEKSTPMHVEDVQVIIAKLIEVKSQLRDFDDAKMLLQIAALSLCSKLSGEEKASNVKKNQSVGTISKDGVSKKTPADSNRSIDTKELDPKPQVPVQVVEKSLESSDIEKIKVACGIVSPRLKAILESSVVDINGTQLLVKNRYKFNKMYFESPDAREILKTVCKEVGISLTEFIFEVVSGDLSDAYASKSKQAPSSKETFPAISQPANDNTDLVEAILL